MSGDVYVTFGADTGALEAAMAKANAEVRALTRELSALANEGLKAGASASAEFVDRFNAAAESLAQAKGHVRDLKDEMRGVGQAAKEGGEAQTVFDTVREAITGALLPIRSLKSGLAEVAEVAAAAFAIDEIKEFVEHMAELGLETERASQILGVSTEEVGALSLVAKASGASLDQLETQFSRMAKQHGRGDQDRQARARRARPVVRRSARQADDGTARRPRRRFRKTAGRGGAHGARDGVIRPRRDANASLARRRGARRSTNGARSPSAPEPPCRRHMVAAMEATHRAANRTRRGASGRRDRHLRRIQRCDRRRDPHARQPRRGLHPGDQAGRRIARHRASAGRGLSRSSNRSSPGSRPTLRCWSRSSSGALRRSTVRSRRCRAGSTRSARPFPSRRGWAAATRPRRRPSPPRASRTSGKRQSTTSRRSSRAGRRKSTRSGAAARRPPSRSARPPRRRSR